MICFLNNLDIRSVVLIGSLNRYCACVGREQCSRSRSGESYCVTTVGHPPARPPSPPVLLWCGTIYLADSEVKGCCHGHWRHVASCQPTHFQTRRDGVQAYNSCAHSEQVSRYISVPIYYMYRCMGQNTIRWTKANFTPNPKKSPKTTSYNGTVCKAQCMHVH